MNILVLYNEYETFTSTVYEHLDSFARFSSARIFFAHQNAGSNHPTDLHLFDAVIIHYSLRLPFDQIAEPAAQALIAYHGLKVLFIQDEYDHTQRAWHWIRRLGIRLVFSAVPRESLAIVYPPSELPGVRVVSNLTGYVPEALGGIGEHAPPSQRPLKIGYRGRALPIRYGALGQEKIEIGRIVKDYCWSAGIEHDIEWKESARLYGDRWYRFIASCRAVLGSESGSNVFDWDGTLDAKIAAYRSAHRRASDHEIYDAVIAPLEMPGLMNQVSARVFEAIACRTALVLFDGRYSGAVMADCHFIPLRKDGSNMPEVIERLRDTTAVDAMTERAYQDVLASGRYSYRTFIAMVDAEIGAALKTVPGVSRPATLPAGGGATPMIIRTRPHQRRYVRPALLVRLVHRMIVALAPHLPKSFKRGVRRMLGFGVDA